MGANHRFFDRLVQSFKADYLEASSLIAEEAKSRRHWISTQWTDTQDGLGKEIKLLEYACGPGTVSMALEPFVTKIIGVDVSESMVAEFNRRALASQIPVEKMFAIQGDLLIETVPEHLMGPDFFDFDIIVISVALHHFADPEVAMERLGSRMKKGGVFIIIDLLSDHHGEEETRKLNRKASQTVHTRGFTFGKIRELYAHAGVKENIDIQVVEKPFKFTVNGHEFKGTIFISRGEGV